MNPGGPVIRLALAVRKLRQGEFLFLAPAVAGNVLGPTDWLT